MAKKVEKTGVYRHKSGHGVFLKSGEMTTDEIMRDYKYDEKATKERENPAERGAFSHVTDAPQDRDERSEGAAPENRMERPVQNRTDADLAAEAAKDKKN